MVAKTKTIIKRIAGRFFQRLFSLSPAFSNIRIILMYHRVLKDKPKYFHDPALFVTANTFEMHLNELIRSFQLTPMESIIAPGNSVGRRFAITFDDGWVDNYEVAFPILKKYGVPATIFIPSAMIGSNHSFWFHSLFDLANEAIADGIEQEFVYYFHYRFPSWRPRSLNAYCLKNLASTLKRLPANTLDELLKEAHKQLGIVPPVQKQIIDWDQAAEMGGAGVSFGAHGLHHYILPTLNNEAKREQIFQSLAILKNRNLPAVPIFSFPNGDWDRDSIIFLSEAGYRGAVTTKLGYNTSHTYPFLLNRVGLHEYISHSPDLLWFRILQVVLSGTGLKKSSRCSI